MLPSMRVAVLCGRGNNGGDGFVVARTLLEHDIETTVYLIGRAAEITGDARTNLEVLKALGIDVVEIADAPAWELHGTDVLAADLIVDALFGTGLTAPLCGPCGNHRGRRQRVTASGRGHRPAERALGRSFRADRTGDATRR